MKKYIDLIGYPIMLCIGYVVLGLVNWDRDPGTWPWADRVIWVVCGLAWGWALSLRIKEE